MSIPNKPYKTYEERLEIIEQKNVNISDHSKALNILKNISYYELINGYKDIFIDSSHSQADQDYFVNHVDFESIYLLFLINNSLHILLLNQLLLIERRIKTLISDVVSRKYGVTENEYFHPDNYSNTHGKRKYLINKLNDVYYRSGSKSSIKHYVKKHNHTPPWVLITEFNFYDTIIWYSCLKKEEKEEVSNEILENSLNVEQDKELLVSMLHLTREYRNGIAHGKRTFESQINKRLPKFSLLRRVPEYVLSEEEYDSGLGVSDIFAVFISIVLIIGERTLIDLFITQLNSLLELDAVIHPDKTFFEILGIPTDTIERLKLLADSK